MMYLLSNAIKGMFNSLNVVLIVLLVSLLLRKRKPKLSRGLLYTGLILFFLFSTAYFPNTIIRRLESRFPVIDETRLPQNDYLIHVLGAGYTDDRTLKPTSQLSLQSTGRLTEGIRLYKALKGSKLVFSGDVASGTRSMAEVYRDAAVALGVSQDEIMLLEHAKTTKEEAVAFAQGFPGRSAIIVTDAVHMPRAINFFKAQGIVCYASPTNFIVKRDENPFALGFIPSIDNLRNTDRLIREFMGNLKEIFI